MIDEQHLSRCGLTFVNHSNPKGLLSKSGKVYQLLGFMTYMDPRDIHYDEATIKHQSHWASTIRLAGFNHGKYAEHNKIRAPYYANKHSNDEGQYPHRVRDQLLGLNLDPESCFVFRANNQILFVFAIYKEPVSISTQFTKNPKQALFDYINENQHIPQLLTDYRLAQEWRSGRDLKAPLSGHYFDFIDKDKLTHILSQHTPVSTKQQEPGLPVQTSTKLAKEARVVKLSDYDAVSESAQVDIMTLHKRIVAKAKQIGGFVDFTHQGQVFHIPLIPLIAWAINHQGAFFEYNGNKWRPLSPANLKTDDDNRYHSDWWIGAGLPIEAYNLNNPFRTHAALNAALSEFAADKVKRNSLDSFTVLSGRHLPPITGNVVHYPSTVESVSDGDVVILPHGGMEFDAYLKKACSSGQGAIIVETGNRVAHLSVVANELGYRVILLPSASKLLMSTHRVAVDMNNAKISKLPPQYSTLNQ